MKLQRFNEFVDTNDEDKYVSLNDNEIKLLTARGNYKTIYKVVYVNSRQIQKLSTGEYLVVSDNVRCSTISSLLKYTAESVKEPSLWFNNLVKNTIKVPDTDNSNVIYWYDNDTIAALQEIRSKHVFIEREGYWNLYLYRLTDLELGSLYSDILIKDFGLIYSVSGYSIE